MKAEIDASFRGALVGAGLIGSRRAFDFVRLGRHRLLYVCDPDRERGVALAERVQRLQGAPCTWVGDHRAALASGAIEVAFLAVPHDQTVAILPDLLAAGAHTLVEKPLGRTVVEARSLAALAEGSSARVGVGFNYRHYPAIARAKQLLQDGSLGQPLLLRMLVGHGGRPEYAAEWKLIRARAGGGALLDPGIHLIDLARFLLGELTPVLGHCARLFWPSDVEDSAVAVLRATRPAEVHLLSSLVEWRNQFRLELFGEAGYAKVEGRMGNYGCQRLVHGQKWAWRELGSQTTGERLETFGDQDMSFRVELAVFLEALCTGGPLPADHQAGLAAMELVAKLYRLAESSAALPP